MNELRLLLPALEIVNEFTYRLVIEEGAFVLQDGCTWVIFLPRPLFSSLRICLIDLCTQL